jgi:hypothetical protein
VPAYPSRVRALADCSAAAVAAAEAADRDEFLRSTDRLAGLDTEQVGLVMGAVLRSLLEDLHPDGLSGDDAQDVIVRCARAAAGWFPEVDVNALVLVLSGALGVHPGRRRAGAGVTPRRRPARPAGGRRPADRGLPLVPAVPAGRTRPNRCRRGQRPPLTRTLRPR